MGNKESSKKEREQIKYPNTTNCENQIRREETLERMPNLIESLSTLHTSK
jgi:hypothetical protein